MRSSGNGGRTKLLRGGLLRPNSCRPLAGKGARRRAGSRVLPRGLLLATGVAICFLLQGCGYHFAGGGEPPGGIASIGVKVLENRTQEAGIERVFTNAIIGEFVRSKRLQVLSPDEADAVLSGAIVSLRTEAASHSAPDQTLETRITATLNLKLRRRTTGEILWEDSNLSYYQEYVEAGESLATSSNRRQALNEVAEFLAEQVHQQIFGGF